MHTRCGCRVVVPLCLFRVWPLRMAAVVECSRMLAQIPDFLYAHFNVNHVRVPFHVQQEALHARVVVRKGGVLPGPCFFARTLVQAAHGHYAGCDAVCDAVYDAAFTLGCSPSPTPSSFPQAQEILRYHTGTKAGPQAGPSEAAPAGSAAPRRCLQEVQNPSKRAARQVDQLPHKAWERGVVVEMVVVCVWGGGGGAAL